MFLVSSAITNSLLPYGLLLPTRPLSPWDSADKHTGVVCHGLLQGIFLAQGSNLYLLHYRQILYRNPLGSLLHSICQQIWKTYQWPQDWKMSVFIPMSKKGKAKECSKMKVKLLSCVQLFVTPWTITYQTPLTMGFSKLRYWSGLPFPSPGVFPDPGIKPRSPTLQADALPSEPSGKPKNVQTTVQLHSFHILARLCSKSFMLCFSSTWTENFQMY